MLLEIKNRFGRRANFAMEAIEYYTTIKKEEALKSTRTINSSHDAYKLLSPYLQNLDTEHFYIVLLTIRNRVLDVIKISEGGMTATVVDVKVVMRNALLNSKCAKIIIAHNHPSNNSTPSENDKQLTKKISEAGKVMDIYVVEHLIITDSSYYSFADEEIL